MALPLSYASVTLLDNTRKPNGEPESSNSEFACTTMTPANAAATVTALGNFNTALAGIVIGNFGKKQLVYERDILGTTPAASPLAQRENKWLFRYHDNTVPSHKMTVSFGTADLTILTGNSEFIDLTTGAGAAIKTAFEALAVSTLDASHAVTLDTVQFVGRNN